MCKGIRWSTAIVLCLIVIGLCLAGESNGQKKSAEERKVSLKAPYPKAYPDAPTDKGEE